MLLCQVSVRTHIPVSSGVQLTAVYSDLSLVYPISHRAPRREAWCGLHGDLQPAATHHRPTGLSPRYSSAVCACLPACSSYGWRRKMIKNTWRCPDQSADSPAGYWLRATVCHCRPSKAEHHLLRACCDENKGRRGRRGMGRRGGECGWGRGGGTWHYC